MTLSLLLLLLVSVAIAQERYADPRQNVNQFAAQPSGVAPTVALGQTRVVGQNVARGTGRAAGWVAQNGHHLAISQARRLAWERANKDLVRANRAGVNAASKALFDQDAVIKQLIARGTSPDQAAAMAKSIDFSKAKKVGNLRVIRVEGQTLYLKENRIGTVINRALDRIKNSPAMIDTCIRNPKFCAGNLGIPRYAMPQFTAEVQNKFLKSLSDSGKYVISSRSTPLSKLSMTQIDLLDPKVHGMAGAMRSGKFGTAEYLPPTFDGPGGKLHVADGQHRYAAARNAFSPDHAINSQHIARADGKVMTLAERQNMVAKMRNFKGVTTAGLGASGKGAAVKVLSQAQARASLQSAWPGMRQVGTRLGQSSTYVNAAKSVAAGVNRAGQAAAASKYARGATYVAGAKQAARSSGKLVQGAGRLATSPMRASMHALRGASVLGRLSGVAYLAGAAHAGTHLAKHTGKGVSHLWKTGELHAGHLKNMGKSLIDTLAGGHGTTDMIHDVGTCFKEKGISTCAGNFGGMIKDAAVAGVGKLKAKAKQCHSDHGALKCSGKVLAATANLAGRGVVAVAKGAHAVVSGLGNGAVAAVKGLHSCATNAKSCASSVGTGLHNVAKGLIINPLKNVAKAHGKCTEKHGGLAGCYIKSAGNAISGTWNGAKSALKSMGGWFS